MVPEQLACIKTQIHVSFFVCCLWLLFFSKMSCYDGTSIRSGLQIWKQYDGHQLTK